MKHIRLVLRNNVNISNEIVDLFMNIQFLKHTVFLGMIRKSCTVCDIMVLPNYHPERR
jgi:uncharacterized membrane protein